MPDHTERRKSPRTQETRERELLTLDYHGREVKTRVLAEDRAAVRSAVLAEVRQELQDRVEARIAALGPQPNLGASTADRYAWAGERKALDFILHTIPTLDARR